MLNRSVLILRYKQPFIDWINAADPSPTHVITLANANDDSAAYLVDVEDEGEFEEWLELNGTILFEAELSGWYTDAELWPHDRSLDRFREWCTLELHTLVLDTGGPPIFDDDEEEEDEEELEI